MHQQSVHVATWHQRSTAMASQLQCYRGRREQHPVDDIGGALA